MPAIRSVVWGVTDFFDLSSGPYPIVSWKWLFGDGDSATMQNPTHFYSATGTYDVSLIIADQIGCVDTMVKVNYMDLTRPLANFIPSDTSICPGGVVRFNNISIPDHPVAAYRWDFGDGSTSTRTRPIHTYNNPGVYQVQLVLENILGCLDTVTKTIVVNTPPDAAFGMNPLSGCEPLNVVFSDLSTGVSGAIQNWYWDFGDGDSAMVKSPVHTYLNPGLYTVSLAVEDVNGCTDDISQDVLVNPVPEVDFFANATRGCARKTISFTASQVNGNPISSYLWDFGDGSTGTGVVSNHTYMNDGVFTVSLTVTDVNGCTSTHTKPQYIRLSRPVANFIYSPEVVCPGTSVAFRDRSTGDTTLISYVWDLGDGNTATSTKVDHPYANAGLYTVSLTVTDVLGCSGTYTVPNAVEVLNPPQASFFQTSTSGCSPFSVQFFNTSADGDTAINSLFWDLGNGNTSTQPNPSVQYSTPGLFQASLIAEDLNGCLDTAFRSIEVFQEPAADFLADDSLGCASKTVQFVDQTKGQAAITDWFWDFGDGNTSNSAFPVHTYTTDGVYTVSLTVTDANGCSSTRVKTNYIHLSRPIANFQMDQAITCPGTQINFSDLSIPDMPLISWAWDFGDGNTSNQQNPGHIYASPGVYSVSLTVRNILGCESTISLTDTITIRPRPAALFSADAFSGCAPLDVNFTNNTIANGSPVVSYTWDFANGNVSNFVDPSQTFLLPGDYDVSLTASDTYGCSDTTTQTVRVYDKPNANFQASDSIGCSPKIISFLDLSQPANAPIVSWAWDFGDGGNSVQQFPNHNYASDGLYSVSLSIEDANGCRDSLTKPDYIRLSHPVANFDKSANQICPGTIVSFVDLSLPDTTITSWQWDFGDGATSSLQNPDHLYQTDGSYTVTLTVVNVLGCSHTVSKPNFVEVVSPPTTQFSPSVLQGCSPLQVEFTDLSTGTSSPIVNWLWEFGDGAQDASANSSHLFTSPGTYTIELTTIDNQGCSSSHTQDVVVHALPSAQFFTLDTVGCAPKFISFSDLSSSNTSLTGWEWNFGDGGSSNQQFPSHDYQNDGLYDVSLIVTDNNGCRDTLIKPQYIQLRNPVPDFSLDQPAGCPGLLVKFTDMSLADTTLVSWSWDFGDGTNSSVQSPSHVYGSSGQYDVSLTITNILGCSQTMRRRNAVSVSIPPEARFGLTDSISCTPFALDIQDQSLAVSSPIVSWQWDFGNGDTALQQEPSYVYFDPGTYLLKLTTVDALGCADSMVKQVVATKYPRADFRSADTVGCAPHLAAFSDLSGGDYPVVSWLWDFGDGNTSTLRNPIHNYEQDGVYSVSLVVFDQNGCSDTLLRPNYIRLTHPVANFVASPLEGCEGLTVNFTSTSLADTTLVSWLWDFGDGNTSIQENPSHVYQQWGTYDVSLTVTNILGCRDTIMLPNYVEVTEPPTAAFAASDTTSCGPFQVNFTDWSSSIFGISQWEWFVDGNPQATSQNSSYFFTEAGTYTVDLVVTDTKGCTDTSSLDLSLFDLPEVDFVASDTLGCAPMTVSFTDRSVPSPVSWQWDFGDGSNSSDQNPAHTYQQDGIYSVSLTVTDANGCTNNLTKLNYIVLDHPTVSFTVDYKASCPPVVATFTTTSSGLAGISRWDWDFGDGNTFSSLNPVVQHTYQTTGTFDASVTITDSLGCTASFSLPAAVKVLDNVLPSPVQIHAVSVLDGQSVEVKFESFKSGDFQYYTLYREEPGQGYVAVARTEYINDTILVDQGLNTTENSYCYKVGITNKCDLEADLALVRNHCTINAQADTRPGEVVLTWSPYIGWPQIAQYEIYKVKNYNPVQAEFVGVVPGTSTRYSELIDDCFSDLSYRVHAIGFSELQESWSDTASSQGENGFFGQATEVVRATVQNNEEVLVQWKAFQDDKVRIIYLEKASDGMAFSTIATMPPDRTSFTDTDVKVQSTSYAYRVMAQDSCGNTTPISNIGKTIHLTVEKDNKTNLLQWTPYESWKFGVQEYRIEVFNDTLNRWEAFKYVASTVHSFRDSITTLKQPRYCYRVSAIENGGNRAESFSNEVCVKVEAGVFGANAFTPNGDGINDIFYLKGINVLTFNLQIYSRWGVKLFETNNIDDGWDGRYNGALMPEGVYMYVARGRNFDGTPFVVKGSISLYR
jgi:gliding motility-associated-like protein